MEGRGKRSLRDDEEQESNRKRPATVVESFKVGSLQELCSYLEPMFRRVLGEEIERHFARIGERSSPKRIEGRNLQLHFKSRLSLPLFTGGKVEGEQSASVHVVLIDHNTGEVVTSGPESSGKLDIVTLHGDFDNEDWSREEFESHVVTEREGKGPLLTGDREVTLKEGVGTLGDLKFTDNSSWARSKKFRLGLKVACESIRVREAKTEAFTVKDHRGELYKKHYPPALNDEVWRLEKIGKDGSFHKKLNNEGLFTVEDFLRLVVRDSQKLRNILGSGMSSKMWEALIEHGRTCVLSGKLYMYCPDVARSIGVVFNNIFELSGLKTDDQYYPAHSLSGSHKAQVDTWVKEAYDNWNQIFEYHAESTLNLEQINLSSTPQNYLPLGSSVSDLSQLLVADPSMLIGGSGCNDNPHALTQLNLQLLDFSYQTQSSAPDPQSTFQANINPFENINNLLSEDAFSLDSRDLLENEDMQDLIRRFRVIEENEDGYSFPTYTPLPSTSFSYSEDRIRSRSVKEAVVGWLKIKAAMRWGLFLRKKAAERRAQIVELEDE